MKKLTVIVLIFCILLSLTSCTAEVSPEDNIVIEDKKNYISKDDMIEDLEYLRNIINNVHPSTIEPLGEPKNELINDAIHNISENMSIEDFYFIIKKILVSLGDAHTDTFEKISDDEKTSKIEYLWLSDGLYIGKDIKGLKKGDKILAIEDKNTEDILNELSTIVSHENLYWVKAMGEIHLNTEAYVNYLGLKNQNDEMVFKVLRNGEEILETINFKEIIGDIPSPIYNRRSNNYKLLENENLAIIEINTCVNDGAYRTLLKNFFMEVNKKNIDNIVIDLRNNTGGNSTVIDEFINYLPVEKYKSNGIYVRYSEETNEILESDYDKNTLRFRDITEIIPESKPKDLIFNGDIYILTSKYTFSSGNDFAVIFQDNNLGTIVGEPTGNAPNCYGDLLDFTLPKSKINFTISYKKFLRPNKEIKTNFLEPDVLVETKIEDILNNIDPQMEKVKELIE